MFFTLELNQRFDFIKAWLNKYNYDLKYLNRNDALTFKHNLMPMSKTKIFLCFFLLVVGSTLSIRKIRKDIAANEFAEAIKGPQEIDIIKFAQADITPTPACLATAATGEVFVGIDPNGSWGKNPNQGYIVELIDENNDGKVDFHVKFATVDSPRGLLPIGDKLFVIFGTYSSETNLSAGMNLGVFEDKNKDHVADGPPTILVKNLCMPKYIQENVIRPNRKDKSFK